MSMEIIITTCLVLNEELVTTMRMCGVTSLEDLHPGYVNTRAVDHLIPEGASDKHPYAKWSRKGGGSSSKSKL